MSSTAFASTAEDPEVLLDGHEVQVTPERRSLPAIRCYLDVLALQQQRVLYSLVVDGRATPLGQRLSKDQTFARIEASTMDLRSMPLQVLSAALEHVDQAYHQLQSAIAFVLSHGGPAAREFWWNLASALKRPLLTLSLLPDSILEGTGRSSGRQLRNWQLEQLGAIIMEVDEACWMPDRGALPSALENRALPWLEGLRRTLILLRETLLAQG